MVKGEEMGMNELEVLMNVTQSALQIATKALRKIEKMQYNYQAQQIARTALFDMNREILNCSSETLKSNIEKEFAKCQ